MGAGKVFAGILLVPLLLCTVTASYIWGFWGLISERESAREAIADVQFMDAISTMWADEATHSHLSRVLTRVVPEAGGRMPPKPGRTHPNQVAPTQTRSHPIRFHGERIEPVGPPAR